MIPLGAGISNQWVHVLLSGGLGLFFGLPLCWTPLPVWLPVVVAFVPHRVVIYVVEHTTLRLPSWIPGKLGGYKVGQWPPSAGSDTWMDQWFHFLGAVVAAIICGVFA